MDEPDGAAKAGEQKRSKALSLEQQRKLEELRERRLQLKNTQDIVSSGKKKKKKKRKRGKKGNDEHPGSSSPKTAASEKQQPSIEDQTPTDTVKFRSQQRHVFAVTSGESTAAAGQLSTAHDVPVSQSCRASGGASGGHGNLDSMTFENPSGMIIPSKSPEVPQKEVAALAKKKRKKLNWGMEIKARWERKGNM